MGSLTMDSCLIPPRGGKVANIRSTEIAVRLTMNQVENPRFVKFRPFFARNARKRDAKSMDIPLCNRRGAAFGKQGLLRFPATVYHYYLCRFQSRASGAPATRENGMERTTVARMLFRDMNCPGTSQRTSRQSGRATRAQTPTMRPAA